MCLCCVILVFGLLCLIFFFFKQKRAYELRIRDWSSDVCSSDLPFALRRNALGLARTIIESGLDVSLKELIELAAESVAMDIGSTAEKGKKISGLHEKLPYPWKAGEASEFSEELYDFILDRLRGYYADKGVPVQHFNAVAELRPASL